MNRMSQVRNDFTEDLKREVMEKYSVVLRRNGQCSAVGTGIDR